MVYFLRALWFAVCLVIAGHLVVRRTLVSDKPFDFAVNVTYGTLAGSGTLDLRVPVWGTTLAIAALTVFAWAAHELAARYPWASTLLAGRPIQLVRDGIPNLANLRRSRLTQTDLLAALRQQKVASVADVELAMLEPDGHLGVIERRPGSSSGGGLPTGRGSSVDGRSLADGGPPTGQ